MAKQFIITALFCGLIVGVSTLRLQFNHQSILAQSGQNIGVSASVPANPINSFLQQMSTHDKALEDTVASRLNMKFLVLILIDLLLLIFMIANTFFDYKRELIRQGMTQVSQMAIPVAQSPLQQEQANIATEQVSLETPPPLVEQVVATANGEPEPPQQSG